MVAQIPLSGSPRAVLSWQNKTYVTLFSEGTIHVYDHGSRNVTELHSIPLLSSNNYGLGVNPSNGSLYIASYTSNMVYELDMSFGSSK